MSYLLFAESRDDAGDGRHQLLRAHEMEMADISASTQDAPSAELLAELEQRLVELERQNRMLARRQEQPGGANDQTAGQVLENALAVDPLPRVPPPAAAQNELADPLLTSHSDVAPAYPVPQPTLTMPASADSSLQRRAVELSLEELDRQQVQRALQQWASGQQLAALQALDSFAFQYPQAHQSREALAKLLLQQGERDRAMQVADIGLSIAPTHPAYKKIKARLLFDQGHVADALQILGSFVPAVHQDLEYHDLMATAQLADRQYAAALTTYQALLQQDPAVGRWWYGLATAMESLGRTSEAVSAYERATQQPDLSLMLRQRSQQRLQELRAD